MKKSKLTPAEKAFKQVIDSKTEFKKDAKFSSIEYKARFEQRKINDIVSKACEKWSNFILRYFKTRLKDPKYWFNLEGAQYIKNYSKHTVKPYVRINISHTGFNVSLLYVPSNIDDFKHWADKQIAWIKAHE